MKKVLSLVLAFVLTLGLFTIPASAAVDVSGLTGDDDCLEILLVGCSYGRDTMQDASYMLNALGIDYILGRLFMGSTSIQTHYEKAVADEGLYSTYHEAKPSQPTVEHGLNLVASKEKDGEYVKLSYALNRRDWDIIILQTTTGVVAQKETYVNEDGESYAKLLGDLVLESDPQAKLGWNMVWANPETEVAGNSVSSVVKNTFEGNSTKMWDGITESVGAHVMPYVKGNGAAADDIFDFIIPSGTVIQNAEGLGLTEAQLYRDNCHLSTSSGCYGVGLAATSAMLGITPAEAAAAYTKDSVTDTSAALIKAAEYALESPFTSIPTAKKIVEDTVFNLRPSELEGKDEAAAKIYLAEKINELVKYTNVAIEASDLTINDYKADDDFTVSFVLNDEFAVSNKEIIVSDGFTITPSVASGSEISAVSELKFEFDMDIKPETLTTDTVLLKEKIKNPAEGAATHNERLYKSTYDEDSRTFTITFNEGDIAPGGEYTVEFTTEILSVDNINMEKSKEFTYTVKYEDYYINDNFSRFETGTQLGTNSTKITMLPYQYYYQQYTGGGNVTAKIEEENGRKMMHARAKHTSGNHCGYIWGYRLDYLPTMDERTYFTEHEVEFKFDGDDDAKYLVWTGHFIVKKAEDGNFYLHYATDSAATGVNAMSTVSAQALCKVEEGKSVKVKFVIYRKKSRSGERNRALYKLFVDNGEGYQEVKKIVDTFVTDEETGVVSAKMKDFTPGLALSITATGMFERPVSETSTESNGTFGVSSINGNQADLYIYSFKYAPYKQVECTPANSASNVPIDSDVVLTFDFPMNEASLAGITVTDDANTVIENTQRVYDSEKRTYTISFNEIPQYKAYYRVDIPVGTVKTSSGHFVDPASFQFQFEPRVLKWAEGEGGGISGDTLTKNIDVTNADAGVIMFAAYSGGKLVGFDKIDITVPSNTLQTLPASVSGEEIADETKKISYKIMYFSDLEKIKPLLSSIEGEAR